MKLATEENKIHRRGTLLQCVITLKQGSICRNWGQDTIKIIAAISLLSEFGFVS